MKNDEMMHSAKGTHWQKKDHKYIRKVGNKYYYSSNDVEQKTLHDARGYVRKVSKDMKKYSKQSDGSYDLTKATENPKMWEDTMNNFAPFLDRTLMRTGKQYIDNKFNAFMGKMRIKRLRRSLKSPLMKFEIKACANILAKLTKRSNDRFNKKLAKRGY